MYQQVEPIEIYVNVKQNITQQTKKQNKQTKKKTAKTTTILFAVNEQCLQVATPEIVHAVLLVGIQPN